MSNIASEIKEILPEIMKHLRSFVVKEHAETKFGIHEEYTAESLKGGVVWALTVLRALIRSPKNFERWTEYAERSEILGSAKNLQTQLANKEYSSVPSTLDALKKQIRPYGLHITCEQAEDLKERAGDLHDACARLEEKQDAAEKIKQQIEQKKESVESSAESFVAALEKLEKLEGSVNQAEQTRQRIATSAGEVDNLREQAKSNEKNLQSFSATVQAGAVQLEEQKQKFDEYKKECEQLLEEARNLVKEAENAVGMKTTEGISAAFNVRYREEKNKKWSNFWWVFMSAVFTVGSAALGYFLLMYPHANSGEIALTSVISKAAVLFAPIYAAWFCASQYVRSKNTADDYGYKSVLAKSLVGFRAQFEDQQEKSKYMKDVLAQIHQDPLRKKHDVETPFTRLVATVFSRGRRTDDSE